MSQVTSRTNIENADLICPITLELFCDPVLAGDGHVYEREAITKWISEHGTSPFTRERIQINHLQPDNYLRRLATQRRNSTVSCNVRNGSVIFPLLQNLPENNTQTLPQLIIHPNRIRINDLLSNLSASQMICFMIFCFGIVAGIMSIIIILRIKSSKSYSTSTVVFEPVIMSIYSSSLTNNIVFIRPWSKNNHYYYKAIQVIVSTNGFYSFQSVSSIDMYSCLYTGYFNSAKPYINLRTCADNAGGNQQFYFRILLLSGNYTLVATTYFGYVIGNFSIIAYGPANVTFI